MLVMSYSLGLVVQLRKNLALSAVIDIVWAPVPDVPSVPVV
jgi:hypothetical protein